MFLDHRGETVVGKRCQFRGGIGVKHLDARRGERKQVHRDAVFVHIAQASFFQIEQPGKKSRHLRVIVLRRIVDSFHQDKVQTISGSAGNAAQSRRHLGNRKSFFRGNAAWRLQISGHKVFPFVETILLVSRVGSLARRP